MIGLKSKLVGITMAVVFTGCMMQIVCPSGCDTEVQ